jgi:hypothetical protein
MKRCNHQPRRNEDVDVVLVVTTTNNDNIKHNNNSKNNDDDGIVSTIKNDNTNKLVSSNMWTIEKEQEGNLEGVVIPGTTTISLVGYNWDLR